MGGQTGTEEHGDKGTSGPDLADIPCMLRETAIEFGEQTTLGFSIDELLSNLAGVRSEPLWWTDVPSQISYAPERGSSAIEIRLGTTGERGRLVRWQPGIEGAICPSDEVRVDLELSIVSAGGALDEQILATLAARSTTRANFEFSLPFSLIRGTLKVTVAGGDSTDKVVIGGELTPSGSSGSVSGLLQMTRGQSTGALQFTYACWPSSGPACVSFGRQDAER